MEPVICFEMLYPELEPARKIAKISETGFRRVEFWGWRDKDVTAIRNACLENRVGISNFSGHRKGSPVSAATHETFLADLRDSVAVALDLGCSTLMLLTNELDEEGQVVDRFDGIEPDEKCRNARRALERALEETPEGINLVLEPLNTRIDHPGYYLSEMATAVSLIEEIGHPRLKVLADLYHLGVMGENIAGIIDRYIDLIGYIHVADIPGRHEPGTGTMDWRSILSLVKEKGYAGCVGFEYAPLGDSEQSLVCIRELWNEVTG